MLHSIDKLSSSLPICSLAINNNTVFFSSHGLLKSQSLDKHEEFSLVVFEHHNISDIKCVDNNLLVFGGNDLSIVSVNDDINSRLRISHSLKQLDDLILDCMLINSTLIIGHAHNFIDIYHVTPLTNKWERSYRVQHHSKCVLFSMLITQQTNNTLQIYSGTAFGEIFVWSLDISTGTLQPLHTFKDHKGVIFRMSISTNHSTLASVSDDRSVRLWNLTSHYTQKYIGWGHVTRVWDVVFIGDSDQAFCTASEDATIKVWDCRVTGCLATLSGHDRDVWRIALTPGCDFEHMCLVSSGNDGTLKLWPLAHHLIASPHEASAAMTAISVPPSEMLSSTTLERSTPQQVTTGAVVPESEPVSSIQSGEVKQGNNDHGSIPSEPTVAAKKLSSSTRLKGVCSIHYHPTENTFLLVLVGGGVWLVDGSALTGTADQAMSANDRGFYEVMQLGRSCVSSDVLFGAGVVPWLKRLTVSGADSSCSCGAAGVLFTMILSHSDSYLTYAGVSSSALSHAVTDSTYSHPMPPTDTTQAYAHTATDDGLFAVSMVAWKPYRYRAANVWFLSLLSAPAILTSYAKGKLQLWTLPLSLAATTAEAYASGDEVKLDRRVPQLSLEFLLPKENMATSQLLLPPSHSETEGGAATYTLIVGDSRGDIVVYEFGCATPDTTVGIYYTILRRYMLFGVHRPELVSCITPCGLDSFCTSGHDGYLNIFALRTTYVEANHGSVIQQRRYTVINQLSCLPIKTPTHVSVVGEGDVTKIYVAGFLGSVFLVYDVLNGYGLFLTEGGHWKRPHHFTLMHYDTRPCPRVLFCCAASADKPSCSTCLSVVDTDDLVRSPLPPYNHTHLQATSEIDYIAILRRIQREIAEGSETYTSPTAALSPSLCHYGTTGFGQTLYCCTYLNFPAVHAVGGRVDISNVLIGGEDGKLRLYHTTDEVCGSEAFAEGRSSISSTGEGMRYLQEVSMSLNIPIKTVTVVYSNSSAHSSRGLVIAAGGRLTYSMWAFSLADSLNPAYLASPSDSSHTNIYHPMNQLLQFIAHGSIDPKASQDHRILTSLCAHVDNKTYHLKNGSTDVCFEIESYLILFGDSRGVISVLEYTCTIASESAVRDTSTIETSDLSLLVSSDKPAINLLEEIKTMDELPIICSNSVRIDCSSHCCAFPSFAMLAAFGDTSGTVSIYLICRQDQSTVCTLLGTYPAHDQVGANSLSIQPIGTRTYDDRVVWQYCIVSGGDDQSLTVCHCTLTLTSTSSFRLVFSDIERSLGASGSALKGVCTVAFDRSPTLFNTLSAGGATTESAVMREVYALCVGYDQRLCLYRVSAPSLLPPLWVVDAREEGTDASVDVNVRTCWLWPSQVTQYANYHGHNSDHLVPAITSSSVYLTFILGCMVNVADVASLAVYVRQDTYTVNEGNTHTHAHAVTISALVAGQGVQRINMSTA